MSELTVFRGRPAEESGRSADEIRVYDFLDRVGVPFDRVDHPAIFTMEEGHDIDRALGVKACKNLFLTTKKKELFYLLMMPEEAKFRSGDVAPQIGSSALHFGRAEDMEARLGVTPGTVTVMGLLNDPDRRVRLLLHPETAAGEFVTAHPLVNTVTLKFRTADLLEKILPALGHEAFILK